MNLITPVEKIYKVGPTYAKKLHSIGIKTVKDLLFHFPFRYDDFSQFSNIEDLIIGETSTVQGKIMKVKSIQTYKRRMNLTEIIIQDDTDMVKAVWFNQPFLKDSFEEGQTVNLSGKVSVAKDDMVFSNPAHEVVYDSARESTHTGRLVPVYHETYGLSSKWLRFQIRSLLKSVDGLEEFLPEDVMESQDLMTRDEALKEIHFPSSLEGGDEARRRFAFEMMFLIQVWNLMQRKKWNKNQATCISFDEKLIKQFVSSLSFKLTNAQRKSSWQILQDLERDVPMNRLLEGDVGSGKTIVAVLAALQVADSGAQVALMAPTEVLAEQHYKTFGSLLKKYKTALLTGNKTLIGSKKETREKALQKIQKGNIKIIIGTHSLIQDKVRFDNLALAIVDEQHRFGVDQRAKLVKTVTSLKDGVHGKIPHLLSMTATPIPRTLALTVYGDLDLSILDEMPKGRKKILTKIVSPASRQDAYQFIFDEVKRGRQIFVICPLVEDSENFEARSASTEYAKLQKIFPTLNLSLLHGRMKPKEKEEIMAEFSDKKTDILVSTSVVEVGIDVPNATVMMIEGADRFGLAQLHQFRGRVGRGEHQSYCFLFTDSQAKKTHQRLKALIKCSNGFDLAERDLKIRGSGEVYGSRQSGTPSLALSNLFDFKIVSEARKEARQIFESDPNLKFYSELKKQLKHFSKTVHLE